MYKQKRIRNSRSGFTLVEILVVIAIIALLIGLVASGIFSAKSGQDNSVTDATLQKVGSALDQQIKAVIDKAAEDARNNGIHPLVLQTAGNDSRRAKVLWTKLLLRREFPVTFQEALASYAQFGLSVPGQFKPLNGLSAAGLTPEQESGICLFLTLTTTRRGMSFNPDDVGPTGIKTIAVGTSSLKTFKDAWEQSIGFIRIPSGAILVNELDSLSSRKVDFRDPVDPEGLLNHGFTRPSLPNAFANVLSIPAPWDQGHNYLMYAYSLGKDGVQSLTGDDDDRYTFRVRKVGQRGGE